MKSSRVAPFEPRHPKHLFLGSFLNPAYIAEDGQKILKGGSNLADIVKPAPKPLLALSPAMLAASVIPGMANMFGAPANAATVPTQATVAPKPQEEKKKNDGGWFGKVKAAGTSATNSVKEVGNSVSKTTGDAWNGVSKWVSEPNPKQEHGRLFGGAFKFGKDLCNGAMGLGQKVLKNNPEALVNPGFLATSVLANSNLKCNTCSKLIFKGEIHRSSFDSARTLCERRIEGTMLTKPTLHSDSLD